MFCHMAELLRPLCECFFVFIDRHSLLPLLEDSGDTEGNRGVLQEHLWQIFISEDEGERR